MSDKPVRPRRRCTMTSSQNDNEPSCSAVTDHISISNDCSSSSVKRKEESSKNSSNDSFDENSCAICLEDMVHAVETPCKHQFCFLCLKGVALTNGYLCPLCRQLIPREFFTKPTLMTPPAATNPNKKLRTASKELNTDKNSLDYQWFYRGMNGWWRYDSRTNEEIESAYQEGKASLTLLIAGHNFTIDLKRMFQQKSNGHGLQRDIKRDTPELKAKGTAGLYTSTLLKAGRSRQGEDYDSKQLKKKS